MHTANRKAVKSEPWNRTNRKWHHRGIACRDVALSHRITLHLSSIIPNPSIPVWRSAHTVRSLQNHVRHNLPSPTPATEPPRKLERDYQCFEAARGQEPTTQQHFVSDNSTRDEQAFRTGGVGKESVNQANNYRIAMQRQTNNQRRTQRLPCPSTIHQARPVRDKEPPRRKKYFVSTKKYHHQKYYRRTLNEPPKTIHR